MFISILSCPLQKSCKKMSGYNENLEKMTVKFLFYLWHFLLELKVEWHYQSHTLHPRSEMATLALWLTEGTHKCAFLWNSREHGLYICQGYYPHFLLGFQVSQFGTFLASSFITSCRSE